MLANNSQAEVLSRKHNCIIGNEADSIAVWTGRYGVKSGDSSAPKTRAAMWQALNHDESFYNEVINLLETRFWFVGILEELDLSMSVFCGLGACGSLSPSGGGRGLIKRPRSLLSWSDDNSGLHCFYCCFICYCYYYYYYYYYS
jgi:hypothetical protein